MTFGLLILILVFLLFIILISILIYCLYGLFKSSKKYDKIINAIENNKSSIFSGYMPMTSNSSKDAFYDDMMNNYMNSIDF